MLFQVLNFQEKGSQIFLERIMNILINANINDDNILKDKNRLLIVETVFFVMKAINEVFELNLIYDQPPLDFTKYILNSKLLNDKKMIIFFKKITDN